MKNIIHHIECDIYKQTINVTFTLDAFKKATGRYDVRESSGLTSYIDGHLVVYIKADHEGISVETLTHETFHAIDFMFADRNVDYTREGMNEHWAYAIGWLSDQILKCHEREMKIKPN